ncbi:hypothetical protein SB781_32055 [Paraburkholderia sp. SIMBA_061]
MKGLILVSIISTDSHTNLQSWQKLAEYELKQLLISREKLECKWTLRLVNDRIGELQNFIARNALFIKQEDGE